MTSEYELKNFISRNPYWAVSYCVKSYLLLTELRSIQERYTPASCQIEMLSGEDQVLMQSQLRMPIAWSFNFRCGDYRSEWTKPQGSVVPESARTNCTRHFPLLPRPRRWGRRGPRCHCSQGCSPPVAFPVWRPTPCTRLHN